MQAVCFDLVEADHLRPEEFPEDLWQWSFTDDTDSVAPSSVMAKPARAAPEETAPEVQMMQRNEKLADSVALPSPPSVSVTETPTPDETAQDVPNKNETTQEEIIETARESAPPMKEMKTQELPEDDMPSDHADYPPALDDDE